MSFRARWMAAAVWLWWLALGTWAAPPILQAAGLGLAMGVAVRLGRGKPRWPPERGEKILLLSTCLLVLNTMAWRRWGLTPRLSPLTAPPLIWTAAFLSVTCLRRIPHVTAFAARLESRRAGLASACVALFTLWFAGGGILRYRAMDAEYWDVGSIGQAMANLARGRGFVSTDPAGFADSRFAQHFEALFAALSPLMLWRFGVEAILVLQALCVGLAAVFTGLAMEKILKTRAAFWAGLLGVCLHPAAGFPLWEDFHGDVFAMLPLAILLWAMAARRRKTFWAAFAAAAACSEYALVTACGIALLMLWQSRMEKDGAAWRRGMVLFAISSALFFVGVFLVMPRFRSPGAPSVLAIHLGGASLLDRAAAAVSLSNLGNLVAALAAFSENLWIAPAALLSALPNLAKDLLFGLDVGNHHFAPAIPALFAGLALGMARALPRERLGEALLRVLACSVVAAALWGPTPLGKAGRKPVGYWVSQVRSMQGKVAQLRRADPHRNRLVTGRLGSVFFDSPYLGFFGSTSVDGSAYAKVADPDVVLELWDQGFPGWAPLDRMQDQLRSFLAATGGAVWREAAPGTLRREEAGVPSRSRDASAICLQLTEGSAAADSGCRPIPLSRLEPLPRDGRALAVLILRGDGRPIPLGLATPGRAWTRFTVRVDGGLGPGAVLQLRGYPDSPAGMPAIKHWPVIVQTPL